MEPVGPDLKKSWPGATIFGKIRQDQTRQETTGLGKIWGYLPKPGMIWQGAARLGKI